MTTNINLQVIDTIKSTWRKVKGTKATFWAAMFFIFCAALADAGFQHLGKSVSSIMAIYIFFGLAFLTVLLREILVFGMLYIGAQCAADMPVTYKMLREVLTFKSFVKIVGYFILILLLLLPALIIFIDLAAHQPQNDSSIFELITSHPILILISLIYMSFICIRLFIASTILVVEKANPWTAIKQSFQATRSNFWNLVGLTILNVLILVVSLIPLGLGLIWTIPYMFINKGVVYRTLKQAD